VGPGRARAAPALPYRCRRLRRTSCGRGRRGGGASWVNRSRRRPRPTVRRPPRPAGHLHAGWQVSALAPGWPRCPCSLSTVPLGDAAARCPTRLGLARMTGFGPDAPRRRPRCRSIRRRWNPSRTRRRLDRDLHGRDLPGSAGGSTVSPRTRRRPPATCRRPRHRRPSRGPASSASPFQALAPFQVLAPFQAPSPELARYSWARAPAAPQARARGRGWPVRRTGRSAVGRSGGARSQPAPVAARPRSLDPSLLPSLGARGRSGSGENGCGHAVLRDGCSVAHATTSAARRAEDLLVQPFVPVRGPRRLPGDPL
jgi:hypothetical protein